MWFWHPLREEIENWVEVKEKEFAEKENKNPRLSIEEWLERYIFTDLHEIFFATSPSELHAWLSRLAENKTSTRSDRPLEWTPEVIQRLKQTYNSISRAIYFWLNSLLEGFVTEFAIDTLKAYNEVERYFFKEYRGKYLTL
jgi:hypothetical protein